MTMTAISLHVLLTHRATEIRTTEYILKQIFFVKNFNLKWKSKHPKSQGYQLHIWQV